MIYEEKKLPPMLITVLLCGFFILMYPLWDLGTRDLTRPEGFTAAVVSGITSFPPDGRIHGELVPYVYPLYPLLTKCLTALGLSMEFSLRLISVISLGAISLMTGIIGYRMVGVQGAAASCCVIFTSVLACGYAVEGTPQLLTSLLIFAGYQCYFNGNQGKGSWTAAWIFLGLFAGLAFYCEGFKALLYLLLPMVFLPRPFTPYRRFNNSGAVLGICILVLFLLCWIIPRWAPDSSGSWTLVTAHERFSEYASAVLYRPFKACLLLVPWICFLYAPFCPALIEINRNPLYAKYLRVLFAAGACIYVLNPFGKEEDLFYLLPLVAMMTGLNYDIVVRRHGDFFCKLLRLTAFAGILLCIGGLFFLLLREEVLLDLGFKAEYLRGREGGNVEILWIVRLCVGILCGILCNVLISRRKAISLITLLTVCIYMLFFWAVVHPYRCAERSRSRLGRVLRDALQDRGRNGMTVYKDRAITGLYPECHYLGCSVRTVPFNKADFPGDKEIYLLTISNIQPRDASRNWTKVVDVIYRNQNLYMWKGISNDRKDKPDEDISNMQF